MTIGSLFSGVGGLELGLEWAGLGPVEWQVEIDPWCRAVLAMRWPSARRFADVSKVGGWIGHVDVICGGFPCQDVSVAGKGEGLDGARSGLWREMRRVVDALRPRAVVVENVAALVARGMDRVVGDLERIGYRVEGRIIAASDVGAPHRRERLFLVAYAGHDGREEQCARDDDHGRDARGEESHRRDPRVADTDGERVRLIEQRRPGGRARSVCDGGEAFAIDDRARGGGGVESRLGGSAHGLPDRVDRWPARPGNAPALWEPSRSVMAYSPVRARRVHALGNAVVPQVAALVGERVRELLA